MNIVKRDGSVVPFDKQKIENARVQFKQYACHVVCKNAKDRKYIVFTLRRML